MITMSLEELAKQLELMDDEEVIYCYVDGENIVASFTTRADITISILTPYEKRQLEQGNFSQDDITRKYFELKQIANFKTE